MIDQRERTKGKEDIVCIIGLGYVKLFCKQKPLLKNAYATFLQAKTFTKLLMLFLLCKNKYFFGKAFFSKERFVDVRGMFSEEERFLL